MGQSPCSVRPLSISISTTPSLPKSCPDPDANYAGSYSADDLRCWADRIAQWDAEGKDVWMYFNNDLGGHAVRNALDLRELLS